MGWRCDVCAPDLTPGLRGRVLIGVSDTEALLSRGGEASASVSTSEDEAHGDAVTVDAGGADAHAGTVQGSALTEAQLPVHSHLTVVSGIGNDTLTGSNSLSQERTAGGEIGRASCRERVCPYV